MTLPLFRGDAEWPFPWPRPRCEDARDRIGWLRRSLQDWARIITTRFHYGFERPTAYETDVTCAAIGLCQRLGWPLRLAIAAAYAERPFAEQAAQRHAEALRQAIWSLAKAGMPGQAILAAARRADDTNGCCLSKSELLEVTRRIAHAAARQRGRRRAAA